MRLISRISVLVFFGLFASCDKEETVPCESNSPISSGMLILCEGLFQQNNSSISFVDYSNDEITNSFFVNRVGRQLGDTGNDLARYGGKIYVVVNVSSTIEVLSATTFASIKQVSLIDGGTAKQPRSIAFHGSNAYVTCYDGYVDVIDTTSLNVNMRIQVGSNPEGLTVANNKLYVSNSGGLNSPDMDTTVSVIDLASHQEIQKITVGLNPGAMITDQNGDVYVIARGDYGSIPSRMIRIDSQNDVVVEQFSFDVSGITRFNSKFLVSYYDYGTMQNSVGLFDPQSEQLEQSNYLDLSNLTTIYGIQYNPFNDRIYATDAMGFTNTGFVHEFSASGTYIKNYHVGLNPSKMIFYE